MKTLIIYFKLKFRMWYNSWLAKFLERRANNPNSLGSIPILAYFFLGLGLEYSIEKYNEDKL